MRLPQPLLNRLGVASPQADSPLSLAQAVGGEALRPGCKGGAVLVLRRETSSVDAAHSGLWLKALRGGCSLQHNGRSLRAGHLPSALPARRPDTAAMASRLDRIPFQDRRRILRKQFAAEVHSKSS